MMEGYIFLHRKIINNQYYFSEPFTRISAWVDLLLLANYKYGMFYKRGIKVEVKRGQVGYDSESLAKRWKWSRGKVLRFLKELENDNQIVQEKSHVTNLISIVNYNQYQNVVQEIVQETVQETVQQTDTNNKDKEFKEKKELNIPFENFWKLYPKKISKPKCEQKWNKLKNEERESIIKTLPNFLSYKPFETYNHPNPETYLNNRRWEDEIDSNVGNGKIADYEFGKKIKRY